MSELNKNGKASRFRGVYRCGNKWKAQIQVNSVQNYLGVFETEEEAAMEYNKASIHAKENKRVTLNQIPSSFSSDKNDSNNSLMQTYETINQIEKTNYPNKNENCDNTNQFDKGDQHIILSAVSSFELKRILEIKLEIGAITRKIYLLQQKEFKEDEKWKTQQDIELLLNQQNKLTQEFLNANGPNIDFSKLFN